jgi:hypothetical protein
MVNAQVLEEAGPQGALPQGEMPGGLPGENFVRLNFVGEADMDQEDPDAGQGTQTADQTPMVEDDEEDEEEDESVEEVCISFPPLFVFCAERPQIAPLPIRVLRNLVGRFWGTSNVEEEGSSEGEPYEEAELDGID